MNDVGRDRFAWAKWLRCNATGFGIGGAAIYGLAYLLHGSKGAVGVGAALLESVSPKAENLVYWLAIGVAVGLAQWIFLRSRRAISGWWPVLTSAGVLVGGSIYVAMFASGNSFNANCVYLLWTLWGLAVGCLQWVLLARSQQRAGLWLVASVVAWPVGGLVSMVFFWRVAVPLVLENSGYVGIWGLSGPPLMWVSSFVFLGVAVGLVTGISLTFGLREKAE